VTRNLDNNISDPAQHIPHLIVAGKAENAEPKKVAEIALVAEKRQR
jgi:hypothetical protein